MHWTAHSVLECTTRGVAEALQPNAVSHTNRGLLALAKRLLPPDIYGHLQAHIWAKLELSEPINAVIHARGWSKAAHDRAVFRAGTTMAKWLNSNRIPLDGRAVHLDAADMGDVVRITDRQGASYRGPAEVILFPKPAHQRPSPNITRDSLVAASLLQTKDDKIRDRR